MAILLAAGRSSRMGAFKPLLPFGDTTVIRSCLNHLRSAGLHEIVVVLGHRATDVREHLQDLDLTFAFNPDPASEMSESIACGVRQLSLDARAVVIGLADHPAVPSEVITTLIGQWRSEGKLIIPDFKGRGGHPVLIDLTFRDELLHLDEKRGLKSLFERHPAAVKRVSVESNYIARDMDTWDDYRVLHEDVFGVPLRDPVQ